MDRQQVEAVITDLEGQNLKPTYENILQRLGGGSRRDLAAILGQLRAEESGSVATMAAPTAVERFQEATALYDVSYARLTDLHVKVHALGVLSPEEENEQLVLERRLANLQPHLAALKVAVGEEQLQVDVDALEAHWGPLVEQKHARLATFRDAVSAMRQAWYSILEVHQAQEGLVATMSATVREKWSFPDVGTFGMWLTSRLSVPQAWNDILLSNQGRRPIDMKALVDVDPGCKQLPRVVTDLRKKETN